LFTSRPPRWPMWPRLDCWKVT